MAVVRVLGVDGCRKGWVGLTTDARGYFGESITELVSAADADGRVEVVAIDIPIGLPLSGSRQADVEARRVIGRRSSSVFSTPVCPALHAASHAEASALNAAATDKGLSQQAYALRTKILEVDAWQACAGRSVIEVHPEVCFAEMAQGPLDHPKSTWAGSQERRHLLACAGVVIPSDLGRAGTNAGVDDILDAAAACWTAYRFARGQARELPPGGETFDDGVTAAIWA